MTRVNRITVDPRQMDGAPCLRGLPGTGGHLLVRLGDKRSVLPMHGARKQLKKGLIEAIKKQLGLK